MNNGSNDLFNFKPRELTVKNPVKDFFWPRLAIQLSKERTQKNVPTKFVGT